MDHQTELAFSDELSGEDAADATSKPMHARDSEHAILDEFLSGSDQGYIRPESSKRRRLRDWLKGTRGKLAEKPGRWLPPWLSAKAREYPHQAPAFSDLPVLTSPAAADEQPTGGSWVPSPSVSTALTAVAVLTAIGSLWVSTNLKADLEKLSGELAQAKTSALHPVAGETDLQLLAMRGQLDHLRTTVTDLSGALDLAVAQSGNQDPAQLQAPQQQQELLTRLAELEQIAAQWEQQQMAAAQADSPAKPQPISAARRSHKAPTATLAGVTTQAVAEPLVASVAKPTSKPASRPAPTPDTRTQSVATSVKPASPPVAAASKRSTAKAAARRNGPWVVNLLSVSSRSEANREVKRLKRMDIHAEIQSAKVKQQTWYRIQVTGFATAAAAQDFGDRIAVQTGLKGAWAARK